MTFTSLQSDVHALLLVSPFFAAAVTAQAVLLDNGLIEDSLEKALNTVGVCVVVSPVVKWASAQAIKQTAFGEASLLVEVMVNPHQNMASAGLKWSLPQAIAAVVGAVHGSPQVAGKQWFKVGDIDLLTRDPGLYAYAVQINAECTL